MLKFQSYDIVFQEVPGEVTLAINISGCPNGCKRCHSPHLKEDSGEALDEVALTGLLEKYGDAITCVCFMGGDSDPREVKRLSAFVRKVTGSGIKDAGGKMGEMGTSVKSDAIRVADTTDATGVMGATGAAHTPSKCLNNSNDATNSCLANATNTIRSRPENTISITAEHIKNSMGVTRSRSKNATGYRHPLKTAWYSGRQNLPECLAPEQFDFIKLGPYVEHLGGLNSATTNQRFYRIESGTMIDITERFREKHWKNLM